MDYRDYFDKHARIIAFTGHREIAAEDEEAIERGYNALENTLDFGHPIVMHNGFAKGFDVKTYSRFWPHELIISVPHPVFQYQLDSALKYLNVPKSYWDIDQQVCKVCFTKTTYEKGTVIERLMARNRHMVDQAKEVICYWNGEKKGGTWNTINYARSVGKPVRDIREL